MLDRINLAPQSDHTGHCTLMRTPDPSHMSRLRPSGARGQSLTLSSLQGQPQEPHPHLDPTPQGLLVGVSTPSLPLNPPNQPRGVHALLCKSNHSFPPPFVPSLCFANGLSHIILHTHSNHRALGTVREVIVAFVHVTPPLPQRSRAPLSAVII